MEINIQEFISGFRKTAEETGVFGQQGSIFPTLTNQSNWSISKGDGFMQLYDGSNIFHFNTPNGHDGEDDFMLVKDDTKNFTDFGKDSKHKHTVQVHRADPCSIYFTVQDGRKNPTYTFKHVNEFEWRAIPKKSTGKTASFVEGIGDKLAEFDLMKIIDSIGKHSRNGIMELGQNPLASAGAGLALGGAYDLGKRTFYNTDEENAQESGLQRAARYTLPAAGLGLTGAALSGTFKNYYDKYPLYVAQ